MGELKPRGPQRPPIKASHPALKKLAELETQITALFERTQEIRALLNAAPTPALEAKELLSYFATGWERRYGRAYMTTPAKEIAALKRAVVGLGFEEVKLRIDRYIDSNRDLYVDAFHPVTLFVSVINRLADVAPGPLREAPVDCHHEPPCRDDVEHTRRKLRESRGGQ